MLMEIQVQDSEISQYRIHEDNWAVSS
uniref:Uncharacterized protein n=1 Tax=Arundo donax TaxID=35708 RepID=A0A0A9C7N3_ARUDO